METTLHRQLKEHYAGPDSEIEAQLGNYRIDVRNPDRLVEVQHSCLSSIRNKVRTLLKTHAVEVVKPLVSRKRLISLSAKNGSVAKQRWSPKRCSHVDLFHELVYFAKVFPHQRLTLRIPLIEIEEWRYPYRRRPHRRQFKVKDQMLLNVVDERTYRAAADLRKLLPDDLPARFDTGQLAEAMQIERWFAQRIAYCLRETGAASVVGKRGNALLYLMNSSNDKSPGHPSRSLKKSRRAKPSRRTISHESADVA